MSHKLWRQIFDSFMKTLTVITIIMTIFLMMTGK